MAQSTALRWGEAHPTAFTLSCLAPAMETTRLSPSMHGGRKEASLRGGDGDGEEPTLGGELKAVKETSEHRHAYHLSSVCQFPLTPQGISLEALRLVRPSCADPGILL